MTNLDSRSLRATLQDGAELALIDVREQREFGGCHLFHAVNTPLSRLEPEVMRLVPRRSTRIVVTAGGILGLVEQAGAVLSGLGYTDVSVCEDDPEAWKVAGFTLYSGINVPSKAFGEAVEHHFGTPSIDAQTLHAMQARGEDLVVLDSRTYAEYHNMNIPGGVSVPGGELAYRVRDFAPQAETTVVVNCAGRTRSIVGAQSVINSGVPNRVVALENGTMGWHLAGLELEHGRDDRFRAGDPDTMQAAATMRDEVAKAYGVSTIDLQTLDVWRGESSTRTLYLLDVRDPAEFAAGHLAGSRSAPGGQLVQATDFQIGVPRGRIVLIDDNGIRATMTAHWLVQMGFPDVHVLKDGVADRDDLETGRENNVLLRSGPEIPPAELAARLGHDDVAVLDLGESRVYRKSHIPSAIWAIRTRTPHVVADLSDKSLIVLTSEDGSLAHLAIAEIAALTNAEVRVLSGGTNAWLAAGHPDESSPTVPADDACVDVYLRAYDRNTDVEAKMQEYIDWEIALIDQIANDPDVQFHLGPTA
ncbi:MAG: thiosulfate sulfurtransferase [Alphaproteobacteria bacterium]|nr:thiosulfate sulfurtransferase [Alphaproteobacteria bacterium]